MTEVRISGLRKGYAGAVALAGVDLAARSGELVTLLGPSGCGKTTTLRCVAGFLAPDAGDILVDGISVVGVAVRARNFGVVFQNYALFPHMTVRENVAYGLMVRGVGGAARGERVSAALEMVGLGALADRLPRLLSGGQQQRVALARALVIRPRLLLLDEPLANLDAQLRQEMRALIRSLQQEHGITAFYVTHDQAEAMALSDRVAVMQAGRVAQFATPREIYQRPVSRYVAAFTGEASSVLVRVVRALPGGRYRVALGAVEIEVGGPEGLPVGASSLLMLRPEAMSLGAVGVPGRVHGSAFLGASQHCEVDIDGGRVLLLLPPNQMVASDESVSLDLDPAQCWLMPEVVA